MLEKEKNYFEKKDAVLLGEYKEEDTSEKNASTVLGSFQSGQTSYLSGFQDAFKFVKDMSPQISKANQGNQEIIKELKRLREEMKEEKGTKGDNIGFMEMTPKLLPLLPILMGNANRPQKAPQQPSMPYFNPAQYPQGNPYYNGKHKKLWANLFY